ncbi:hypothetical protein [Caproiciproducens faecalis]|uniref:Uncharacterized protein n=1 Tax=Caproiciproducens faecalis TaxID=2820301 RepID=A0ABS7DRM4_9FIRM|nr:hypothetical protein [Caproiciproducens faecalis]MBW7573958.1 hypothetical protein [Caproiciproducens faecalis]
MKYWMHPLMEHWTMAEPSLNIVKTPSKMPYEVLPKVLGYEKIDRCRKA